MKDNLDFNIQFVSIIKNHPCVYNYHTQEYSCKITQEKAWRSIGREVDATASECKERWKNLRACYTRHLKYKPPLRSGAKTKRAYYLAEHMNFLKPFTKSRQQTGIVSVISKTTDINSCPVMTNENENDVDNINEQVVDKYEFPDKIDQSKSKECIELPSASSFKTHNNNNNNNNHNSNDDNNNINNNRCAPVLLEGINKAALDFFSNKKNSETEEDTDLCFFKSLLPDMKLMTPEQKRCFKIQMINLAGSILNASAIYNQHRTHSFIPRESFDYKLTRDKRPHSNSSTKISSSTSSLNIHAGISPCSGASLNIPLIKCKQDNANVRSVIFSNLSPSVQHQTRQSVQQPIEEVRYTYPYYN